jgi:hypothetical protein
MNKSLNTLAYIHEQTSYPSDYKTPFGYKMYEKKDRFYVTFDAILQSFGVLNRNKRMYLAENVMDRINNDVYIQTMLKQNSWMGELDHPSPVVAGTELSMNRISNTNPERSSHYIRSPRLCGNLLEAHIQTDSSNENGMNMAIKIVDGKITPAFSARVLGDLQNRNGQPIVNVKKLITYDFVLFPSHADALGKISQPIVESTKVVEEATGAKVIPFKELAQMVAQDSKETEWLCESLGLKIDDIIGVTSTGNSVVVEDNKSKFVVPITQAILREKTRQIMTEWLHS